MILTAEPRVHQRNGKHLTVVTQDCLRGLMELELTIRDLQRELQEEKEKLFEAVKSDRFHLEEGSLFPKVVQELSHSVPWKALYVGIVGKEEGDRVLQSHATVREKLVILTEREGENV